MTLKQKIIVCIPLVVAIAAGVVLWFANASSSGGAAEDRIIEAISPPENSSVLQQSAISIDLQAGWDTSFVINGKPIPDDQLSKVISQGRVTFQPGQGKEIEFLQAAQNCVAATYWPLSNPEQKFKKQWCFKAT